MNKYLATTLIFVIVVSVSFIAVWLIFYQLITVDYWVWTKLLVEYFKLGGLSVDWVDLLIESLFISLPCLLAFKFGHWLDRDFLESPITKKMRGTKNRVDFVFNRPTKEMLYIQHTKTDVALGYDDSNNPSIMLFSQLNHAAFIGGSSGSEKTTTTMKYIWNYLLHRLNDPDEAEYIAELVGTMLYMDFTVQVDDDGSTGLGSARQTQEFVVHPNTIKGLQQGQAVMIDKSSHQ